MFIEPSNQDSTKLRPRNGDGRFISKNTKPADAVTKEYKISGAAVMINDAVKDPSIDKPLLSLTINNPIRKLLQWVKEIKKKQTTTFEFKIKVPLIALPVFLVVLGSAFTFFFNLGKETGKNNSELGTVPVVTTPIIPTSSTTILPIFLSKVGVVKGTYQVLSTTDQLEITPTISITVTPTNTPMPTPTHTPTPLPPLSRFVLLDKDEKITFLIASESIDLDKYLNKRVLVSGLFDSEKNTLQVKKTSDIEVLP